jgi:hypothetical protein
MKAYTYITNELAPQKQPQNAAFLASLGKVMDKSIAKVMGPISKSGPTDEEIAALVENAVSAALSPRKEPEGDRVMGGIAERWKL